MQLETEDLHDARIVTVVEDRIDAVCAVRFKEAMRGYIEGGPDRVILDLNNVTFFDSSALGAVVASLKLAREGQSFELCGLTPPIAHVFRLTRMDRIFTIHANRDVFQKVD